MIEWMRDFAMIAAGIALCTGALAIVLNDRRWMLLMLAGEYVALTWLAGLALPIQVAAAKLVGGMMACAILALSVVRVGYESRLSERERLPSGFAFRIIGVLLVSASVWGLVERGGMFLPQAVHPAAALGSGLLLGLGLLHLGISDEPFRVGIGLLGALAGFEIVYVVVEPSLAVLAFMTAIHIGIAIVVSYLIVGASLDKAEEVL
ncbi:MAG: hypothetical protein PVI78_07295 [Anaerolineales bacterium]|jgi:hypothetical protein